MSAKYERLAAKYEVRPTPGPNRFWALLNTTEWRCRVCAIEVSHTGPFDHECEERLLVQKELF